MVVPGGLAAPDHRLREQMKRLQFSPQPRETLTTYTCPFICSYMLMYIANCVIHVCIRTYMLMYIYLQYIHVHVLLIMRGEKEGRKKEASKVIQTTRQSNTAHQLQSLGTQIQ